VGTVRESLVLFERNSISSYSDKLPEANTVGVPDIIPLLQVVHGKVHSALSEDHASIGMHIFTVFIRFFACYTYQSDL
jgi:hypothetical protein